MFFFISHAPWRLVRLSFDVSIVPLPECPDHSVMLCVSTHLSCWSGVVVCGDSWVCGL